MNKAIFMLLAGSLGLAATAVAAPSLEWGDTLSYDSPRSPAVITTARAPGYVRIAAATTSSPSPPPAVTAKSTIVDDSAVNTQAMTIDEFIRLVRAKNERIISQKLEFEVSRQGVNSAWGKFEPEAVASYEHQVEEQKYTAEDKRRLLTTLDQRNDRYNNYKASIEGLVPTGATVSVGYNMSEISNQFNTSTGDEYQSNLVAEVTQPLLKNAGIRTTMADIDIAQAESNIAFQDYRQQMMQVVHDAAAAYWNLVLAREQYRISLDSVKVAEEVLHDSEERVRLGKMAQTDVFEARAGLAARKAQTLAAENDLNSARNELYNYISRSAVDPGAAIEPATPLARQEIAVDPETSVAKALKYRPDYIAALQKLEREDVRVAFTKNQRWPQLDLKGSYGLNGLDYSVGDSFDDATSGGDDFWTVGLELRIPLGGGKKTKSELIAARHRKKQALLEAKAIETALKNAVHTSALTVKSAARQEENYRLAAEMKKKLLDVEMTWLKQGKSDSKKVLEREDEYYQARSDHLRSIVEHNNAVLALELVEGTLLERYGIDACGEK